MRNLAVRLAVVPMVFVLGACVEQEPDKPSADDLSVAKQNLLSSPPAPRYAVNADLDGKVVFLGLDVDPLPAEGART